MGLSYQRHMQDIVSTRMKHLNLRNNKLTASAILRFRDFAWDSYHTEREVFRSDEEKIW